MGWWVDIADGWAVEDQETAVNRLMGNPGSTRSLRRCRLQTPVLPSFSHRRLAMNTLNLALQCQKATIGDADWAENHGGCRTSVPFLASFTPSHPFPPRLFSEISVYQIPIAHLMLSLDAIGHVLHLFSSFQSSPAVPSVETSPSGFKNCGEGSDHPKH